MTAKGYRRSRTVHLTFGPDDGDMDGFEITLRRLNVDQVLNIADLADFPEDAPYADQKKLAGQLSDQVGEQIVSWNLEDDDGQPIAPSGAALRAEDIGFLLQVTNRWVEAVVGVPAPLAQPSADGEPSEVPSIPMDDL